MTISLKKYLLLGCRDSINALVFILMVLRLTVVGTALEPYINIVVEVTHDHVSCNNDCPPKIPNSVNNNVNTPGKFYFVLYIFIVAFKLHLIDREFLFQFIQCICIVQTIMRRDLESKINY